MPVFPLLSPGAPGSYPLWPSLLLAVGILFAYLLAHRTGLPATARRSLALLFAFSIANLAAAYFPLWVNLPAWIYVRVIGLTALFIGLIEAVLLVTVDLFLAWRGRPFPKIIRDTFTLVLSVVVLFAVLREILNVNLTSLVATSAVLSVVIGLALQDTLGNFFSGLALQMEQPLKIGDWVNVDTWTGQVSQVTWRSVRIRTLEGDEVNLPNSTITKSTMKNYSQPTSAHRHSFRIGTHYRHAPHKVIAAVLAVSHDVPGILDTPPVQVIVAEFGDSAIIYEVRFWLDDFPAHLIIAGEFQAKLWYRFRRDGIEIPFPIRTLHVVRPLQEARGGEEVIRRALGKVEILKALSDAERDLLTHRVSLVPYGSGERIICQGEAGGSLFVIIEGEVSVRVSAGEEERQVTTLGPGDVFGEMSLLTGEPRTATVVALADVSAVNLTKEAFREVVTANPAVLEAITAILKGRKGSLESAQREAAEASAAHRPRHDLLSSIRSFFGID
jgi:small-conductance mechanosensitive channel